MERIAIIGGGVAGLTAGYLLSDKYDITLFEKDDRIGGNVYTLNTKEGDVIDISVFFYSRAAYPNFCKLLSHLGIKSTTRPLECLSQSFRNLDTDEHYYLNLDPFDFSSTFHPKNFKSLRHGSVGFYHIKKGIKMSKAGKFDGLTLKESLEFLPGLTHEILKIVFFPVCIMTSMYWDELMNAPAEYVYNKMDKLLGNPVKFSSWRMFPCKTREYVNKLSAPYQDNIIYNADISNVQRNEDGVTLTLKNGTSSSFDKVIFACPTDQALKLLEQPSSEEDRLLGAWKYHDGLVVIHKDNSSYPPEKIWGMYSYLYTEQKGKIHTSINAHYRFQKGVSDKSMYLGTQYPNFDIDESLIEFKKVFRTPIYDRSSVPMIDLMPSLNGKMNTYYCGSHFGYGLHEDAVTSAVDVSKQLGVDAL